jgi:autotransporter translocation and assembly factor TamB
LDVDLTGASVDPLKERHGLPITGTLRGQGRIAGKASDPDWNVEAHLDSEALLGEFPGEARLFVEKVGSRIELTEISASTKEASLRGAGTYLLDSETIEGRLGWSGISLGYLVNGLDGLDGRLAGEVEARGSLTSPDVRAELRVEEGAFRGRAIEPASLEILTEGERVELELHLGDARLAHGSGPLQDPYPLQIEVDLSALPFTPVVRGWTEVEADINVSGKLSLEVPVLRPEELEYRAHVESYESVFPGWSHRASGFTIEGDMESLLIRGLELTGEDRRFSVDGAIPLTGESSFDLNVAGEFGLEPFEEFLEELTVEGRGRADLTIGGTYAEPALSGEFQFDGVSGSWNHFSWDDVQLRARAEGERLRQVLVNGILI